MILIHLFFSFTLPLKPIYLIPGFGDSPIYSQVMNPFLYPECPSNISKIPIQNGKTLNNNFLSAYPSCAAKLLRIYYNKTTGRAHQLPFIVTDSVSSYDPSIFYDKFANIMNKIKEFGYINNINLFGVGYNYYFHPATSNTVYDKLKNQIEQVYLRTGEKSIFISVDQGTSFASIFLSNYSQAEWVKKYIDSVIFLSPIFSGLPSYPQLLTKTIQPFTINDELKESLIRMPGIHIRMPSYEFFEKYAQNHILTYKTDFNESKLIFEGESDKYLKIPIPEPPTPSLIIYNNKNLNSSTSSVLRGVQYACSKWNSVRCINFSNQEILTSQNIINPLFEYISGRLKKSGKKNLLESYLTIENSPATGNYSSKPYINSHIVPPSEFTIEAPSGQSKYPISNAFDHNPMTYYMSSVTNSDTFNNTINITFSKEVTLDAILMDTVYSTSLQNRTFLGFPTLLFVYASTNNGPFTLRAAFTGTPVYPTTTVQFVFPQPVKCDKLKLEFVNVTKQSKTSNSMCPMISELYFVQHFDYEVVGMYPVDETYNNDPFFRSHVIDNSMFTFSSTEGMPGHSISNIFDDDDSTYYMSKDPNSATFNNSFEITFSEPVKLEALIFDFKYTEQGGARTFHGLPTKSCIYTSIGNSPYSLYAHLYTTPYSLWNRTQLIFRVPIEIDRIKFEIIDCTDQTIEGASKSPIINGLRIYRYLKPIINFTSLSDNFNDVNYFTSHVIKPSTLVYNGPEGTEDHPLSFAFDGAASTYYMSKTSINNTFNNTIIVDFGRTVTIDAFLYDTQYKSYNAYQVRNYHGIPKILYVYTSKDNEPFSLNSIFVGSAVYPMTRLQFTFPELVTCDKIKLEFLDVTLTNIDPINNSKNVVIGGLYFFFPFEATSIDSASTNYSNSTYVDLNKVDPSTFTCEAPEGAPNYPISNLFDGNATSFYLSSSPNNSSFVNKITFNFDEVVFLEAILVDTTYSTRGQTRTFTGFPTALNIYSSIDDEPFVLNAIFIGTPVYPWTRVQFVFPDVIKCNKLIFECNELTTTGKGKYVFLAGLTFIKDPSHSTVPTENLTYLPIVDVCQSGIPCSFEGTPDHQVVITINSTSFTSVSNEEDGGAIKLTNAGIVCESITFDRCNSKSGGGGSIYINNDISQNNDIIINDVSFSNCKAKFGGAVFVHTESYQENVNIVNCIFKTCQALSSSSSESESLIGGSALFLFSKQSNIYECTFSKNIGESQLKIFNSFENHSSNGVFLEIDYPKTSNIIRYCRFEIDRSSKASIYYLARNNGVFCYVKNSVFVGILNNGNFHINGKCEIRLSPKISVEGCKFSSDYLQSINLKSDTDYITITLQKQTFNYEDSDGDNDDDGGTNTAEIFGFSMIGVFVILVIVIVILIKKHLDTVRMGNEIAQSNNI